MPLRPGLVAAVELVDFVARSLQQGLTEVRYAQLRIAILECRIRKNVYGYRQARERCPIAVKGCGLGRTGAI